jgi:hypothetical protein
MDDRRKCTVAIARETGTGRELVGGGVCVQLDHHAIAFSAGHVLHAGGDDLWLGADGATVPVRSALTKGQEPYAPPDIRRLDMGFVRLQPSDLARLHALEFISPLVLDLEDEPPTVEYLAIAPADRMGVGGRVIAAREAPRDAYPSCDVDVATHVVVDVAGDVDPAGLLGSGVWRPAPGPAGDLLTGVIVDVRPLPGGSRLRLVATRAGILVYCVFGVLGIGPTRSPQRRKAPAGRRH